MKTTRLATAFALLVLTASRVQAGQAPVLEREAARAYVDAIVAERMTRSGVPGLVVSVVADGEVLVLRGYGVADLASRAAVDPATTLFRMGSVSKVVTATAVMQLVEQGRLDLAADVNRYMTDFAVPPAFGRPVTAAQLLTHTAGFEERLIGTAVRTPAAVLPLATYLRRDMPARVYPPGDIISYSNHGYTLLGHVVEAITGTRFDEYVDRQVLAPLGMSHSTFAPAPRVPGVLATGYERAGSVWRQTPAAFVNIVPAAGLVSTAADMSRLMLAHLGTPPTLLAPATLDRMHAQHFTHHPFLPGMAYGLFESFYFNERQIFHVGGIRGYSSLLVLLPGRRTGVFVANNGYDQDVCWSIADGFIGHFFPASAPPSASPARQDAARFSGVYRHVKHANTTIEALTLLFRRPLVIYPAPDGTLNIYGSRFAEAAPLAFQRVNGFDRVAFRADQSGRITHMFLGQEAHERLRWHQMPSFHQALMFLFAVVFVSGFVAWRRSHALGVRLDVEGEQEAQPSLQQRRLVAAASALNLAFLAGVLVVFASTRAGDIWFGVPRLLPVLLSVPLLSAPFGAALAVAAVRSVRGPLPAVSRLRLWLVAAASVAFLAWLAYWRLLGWHY